MQNKTVVMRGINIALFLLLPVSLLAQQEKSLNLPEYTSRKYAFGFMLSLNATAAKAHLKPNDTLKASIQGRFGFDMGIVAEYDFSKRFGIRFVPAIDFQERDFHYEITHTNGGKESYTEKLESAYLRLPLMARINYDRIRNQRLYYLAGGFYNVNMAKNKTPAVPRATSNTDYGVCAGLGFDFFLPRFKLALEFKINAGLKNMMLPNNSTPFDVLKTRLGVISLTFEG